MKQRTEEAQAQYILSQEQLSEIIRQGAKAAAEEALKTQLDNCMTNTDAACCTDRNGGTAMPSSFRKTIHTPDGRTFTLTGTNADEAISKLIMQLAPAATADEQGKVPLFKTYAVEWQKQFHDKKCCYKWKYESQLLMDKHILPFFGRMRLNEIKTADIQRFYDKHSKYATETVKKMRSLLNGIFDSAIEDDYITKNPAKSKRLVLPKKATERKALTTEEVQDILAHMSELNEQQQLYIALSLFTGMRRGELLALTWRDIDLDRGVIHITKAVEFCTNEPRIKPPKTKAGIRSIPISDDLRPYLTGRHIPDRYVIGNGTRPITKRTFEWRFGQDKIGIDLHGASAHVFRHTFATAAVNKVDIKTLQGMLGHSKCDITLNRYAHVDQDRLAEAGKQINKMYETV